jgi:hypothetical protein
MYCLFAVSGMAMNQVATIETLLLFNSTIIVALLYYNFRLKFLKRVFFYTCFGYNYLPVYSEDLFWGKIRGRLSMTALNH